MDYEVVGPPQRMRWISLLGDDLAEQLLRVVLVSDGDVLPCGNLRLGGRRALLLHGDGDLQVALVPLISRLAPLFSTWEPVTGMPSAAKTARARFSTLSIEPSTMDSAPRLVR